jgi:hypothetical protein
MSEGQTFEKFRTTENTQVQNREDLSDPLFLSTDHLLRPIQRRSIFYNSLGNFLSTCGTLAAK